MTDEEEKFENAEMEEFAENEDQEKELARDNVMIKEKSVQSENLPKEKQESGDLKGEGEEGKHELQEAVKDEAEKNGGFESPKGVEENDHDLKKKEEREDVLKIKDEVEGELVKEEIAKGVIKEGETKMIDSEKDDESKKVDKEKDEPKKIANEEDEPEKIDKENDEPKKIENCKNEPKSIDKEKDEPKKIDKEKDDPKKIGEENDESKKIDKEKDGSNKEGKKNIRSNEENREAKKEDEKNNGVDQETSQSKKVDEEKNKKDQENNASRKEDEMKESGDKENDGSKKEEERDDAISCNVDVNNISFKEQANQFSELKESEKMALVEIKTNLEEAIKGNRLFKDVLQRKGSSKPKEKLEGIVQEAIKRQQEESKKAEEGEKDQKDKQVQEEKENKEKAPMEVKKDEVIEESEGPNLDITLWGIPLLPSKGDMQTDVLLLKFLRARDYKAGEAFEMLRNTLQWRKQNNIDSILNEDFANDFSSAAYMSGKDHEGHPVCYNIFGALDNIEMYNKTLSSEEKQERFLRWRIQLMEKGIQNLDFSPTGVSSLMQISDLKNTPGPSKKEVRLSAKQGVSLLLDNYPEFVAKHIFINVPFWYYAFTAVLSPFLNARTKSKFVYARPAKVSETLLKYIAIEELPVQYGGLKRENDSDFSLEDNAVEVPLKAGSTEKIELLAPEVGRIVWDLTVLGWEVNYKEEFVPDDEGSYTVIVQKGRKIETQEVSIRNSFRSNEPGKIVISMDNSSFKKKRVFYRYKIDTSSSSSTGLIAV